MTIKVYQIDRDDSQSYELYTLDPDEEYTGEFVDGKTAITVRAGKEGFGLNSFIRLKALQAKDLLQRGTCLLLQMI